MDFDILESKDGISYQQIDNLFELVGWGKGFYPTIEKWQRVLKASTFIAYIKKDDQVIAFARILEDGIMCMFYDMCVHPDYQGNGLGTKVVSFLLDKIKDMEFISIGLFVEESNPSARKFYESVGFEKVLAMEHKKYLRKY
ncbi:MAG: GNAT family N-acetyltransferase [Parachlamydiales bacterium]|nr:GNAT family N-acetyltransferase [Parachlamydiales bacterium]